jgi:hypothetical protein
MIRIMTATEPLITAVIVDGQVAAEYVEAIDTCVKQAIARGRPVHLFLRDVSSIDESGRGLLGRLAASGVHLSANGVYISYVVAQISRSAAEEYCNFGCGNAVRTGESSALRRQAPSRRQRRLTESITSGGE